MSSDWWQVQSSATVALFNCCHTNVSAVFFNAAVRHLWLMRYFCLVAVGRGGRSHTGAVDTTILTKRNGLPCAVLVSTA